MKRTGDAVVSEQRRDENRYQWLADFRRDSPSFSLGEGQLLPFLITEAAFAGVLSLPVVTRATGVDALEACAIVAAHALTFLAVVYALRLWADRSPVVFHLGIYLTVLVGIGAACAFPALSDKPGSILWSLPIIYAAFNGSMSEVRPSWLLLILHVMGPLLTHWAFGANDASFADPLIAAGFSGASYHFLALRGGAWRVLSARHAQTRELLREQEEELSRMRLARELHDGVGSTLGLLALHASLLERHNNDPKQVLRLAALARDAARGGLDDLRGVLEAVAPEEDTLQSLAKSLDELARRNAPGVDVRVTVAAGAGRSLTAAERLVVVRIFQEALRNAVLHGEARRVDAALDGTLGLKLEVTDDGTGFDQEAVRRGRGLSGMHARATELGGRVEIATRMGEGATVSLMVPSSAEVKAS